VDVGTEDEFYMKGELLPENFQRAAIAAAAAAASAAEPSAVSGGSAASGDSTKTPQVVDLRFRRGYNHGYYFVSTFMDEHFKYAAQHLGVELSP